MSPTFSLICVVHVLWPNLVDPNPVSLSENICVYTVFQNWKKKKKKILWMGFLHIFIMQTGRGPNIFFSRFLPLFSLNFLSFFLLCIFLQHPNGPRQPEHQMHPDWKIGTWWKWVWTKTVCFTAKIIGIAEQETMAVWIDVVGYMAMPLWALRHQVWYGFLAVGVPMGCGFGMRLLNMLWKPWKNQPWKLSQLPLLLQSFESSHDVLL